MSDQAHEWIGQAIALAIENVRSGRGGPFGALIVKRDRVIATGSNQVTVTNDPTAHAEIVAIRGACLAMTSFQLSGCELYSSCEPCPMCLSAIYWTRLARYYYACTRAEAAKAGFDDALIHHELNVAPEEGLIHGRAVAHEDRMTPFLEWARSTNKVPY